MARGHKEVLNILLVLSAMEHDQMGSQLRQHCAAE